MERRRDIEGIRGLAVLAVVAYHVELPGLGGGFAGVDAFFVVSGFLITRLLLDELAATGRIDWAAFYARRVRRLLPALTLVVLCTLGAGAIVLFPGTEQPGLAREATATALFVANLHFRRESLGYFDDPGTSPLLHMWSLAVEEQFYAGWPLFIALAWRIAGRRVAVWIGFATAASLVACAVATVRFPGAAFFLAPARAWEFGTGALLATAAPLTPTAVHARWLAAMGLGGLAVSFGVLDAARGFPVPGALAPVAATAVLIAAGPAGGAMAGLLESRALVAIGRWSYSWYLWHWPALVLSRSYFLGDKDLVRDAGVALATLPLAALTVRLVEDPIRFRRPGAFATARGTLLTGVGMSLAMLVAAFGLQASAEAEQQDPGKRPLARCFQVFESGLYPPLEECVRTPSVTAPLVLVWGDSHAHALLPGVEQASAALGIGVAHRARPSCPPMGNANPACARFAGRVRDELADAARSRLRGVILSARWGHSPQRRLQVEAALPVVLRAIESAGLRALVVEPTPEFRWPVASCLLRRPSEVCEAPDPEAIREPMRDALRRVVERFPGVARVHDAYSALCPPPSPCPVQLDGLRLYDDRHHLSAAGAARALSGAEDALRWLVERP